MTLRNQLFALLFITVLGTLPWRLQAAPTVDIPSLSVEEAAYGDSTDGANTVNVEGIRVRISAFNRPPQTYTVQCLFLKKTAVSGISVVDDAVTFDVGNCNDIYQVMANPIVLPPRPKPAAKGAKPAASSTSTSVSAAPAAGSVASVAGSAAPSTTPEEWQLYPRAGYIVRILNNGTPLATAYSSHVVQDFCTSHPEILTQGASAARHLEASSLVQSLLKR